MSLHVFGVVDRQLGVRAIYIKYTYPAKEGYMGPLFKRRVRWIAHTMK